MTTKRSSNDLLIIDGCTPRIASDALFNKIRDSGITAVNVSLVAAEAHFYDAAAEMNVYYGMVEAYPDQCLIALTTEDILRAKKEKKVAIIFSPQNAQIVEENHLVQLPLLYRSGVRMIQLTYNERNRLGDGCMEPENRGLTLIGREVVLEMNRLGIVVDLSHVGDRTAMDAIEYSQAPCVFSHANARALAPSPRNKPDELIKAIAAKGGLIGICPYAPFCEPALYVRPTLEDYFRHMDYVLDLVGPDHVGIGTDIAEHWTVRWNGGTPKRYPEMTGTYTWKTIYADGFHSIDCFPRVIEGMSKRGYSDADIAKIVGGNWLRVYKAAWGR